MRRRFEISIASQPRPISDGQTPPAGWSSRIKAFLTGFAALVLVAAALVVGVTLGTAVAVTIGVLVIGALTVLIVRGVLDRMRARKY
jgi:Flp pilus assembly protein TadB